MNTFLTFIFIYKITKTKGAPLGSIMLETNFYRPRLFTETNYFIQTCQSIQQNSELQKI